MRVALLGLRAAPFGRVTAGLWASCDDRELAPCRIPEIYINRSRAAIRVAACFGATTVRPPETRQRNTHDCLLIS